MERDGWLEFMQEMELLGGSCGGFTLLAGYKEGEEPNQVYGSNGRGREQRLAVSGTLMRLSPQNKAEYPGIIEINYCN